MSKNESPSRRFAAPRRGGGYDAGDAQKYNEQSSSRNEEKEHWLRVPLAKEIPAGFVHAAFCDVHRLSPVLPPAGLAAGRKIEVGKRWREFRFCQKSRRDFGNSHLDRGGIFHYGTYHLLASASDPETHSRKTRNFIWDLELRNLTK